VEDDGGTRLPPSSSIHPIKAADQAVLEFW